MHKNDDRGRDFNRTHHLTKSQVSLSRLSACISVYMYVRANADATSLYLLYEYRYGRSTHLSVLYLRIT
jgi:hypothetical protein